MRSGSLDRSINSLTLSAQPLIGEAVILGVGVEDAAAEFLDGFRSVVLADHPPIRRFIDDPEIRPADGFDHPQRSGRGFEEAPEVRLMCQTDAALRRFVSGALSGSLKEVHAAFVREESVPAGLPSYCPPLKPRKTSISLNASLSAIREKVSRLGWAQAPLPPAAAPRTSACKSGSKSASLGSRWLLAAPRAIEPVALPAHPR